MDRLVRFLRYPLPEQWVLVQVSLLLIILRLGLIFLPFRTLYRFIQRIAANQAERNLSSEPRPPAVPRSSSSKSHRNPALGGNPREDSKQVAVRDLYQKRVIWAMNRAGAPILGDKACLTQALAGKILLGRFGVPVKLRIGVQKGGQNKFQAHAWLESDGQVLIGGAGAELDSYTILPDLDGIRT